MTDELGPCLDAVVEQLAAGDELFVLVNGPVAQAAAPDAAVWMPDPAAAERARGRGAAVTIRTDPIAGLARARDRAMTEASGDVVVFLDDDARPEPGWLAALRSAFTDPAFTDPAFTGSAGTDPARTDPGAPGPAVPASGVVAAAGGPIRLRWPDDRPPRWFDPRLAGYYSSLDLGAERRLLTGPQLPFGANLAIRRSSYAALGAGFRSSLGRRGSDLLGGEETDVLTRLRDHGGGVVWVPDAVVVHHVDAERLRLRWLVRRAYAQGRTDEALDAERSRRWSDARPHLARATIRGWRALGDGLWRGSPGRARALTLDAARRARHLGRARQAIGRR